MPLKLLESTKSEVASENQALKLIFSNLLVKLSMHILRYTGDGMNLLLKGKSLLKVSLRSNITLRVSFVSFLCGYGTCQLSKFAGKLEVY